MTLPNGRVGRWSYTDRDGLAVVVSGLDVYRIEIEALRVAFEGG